jgi:hypothetical protein
MQTYGTGFESPRVYLSWERKAAAAAMPPLNI